MQKKIIGFSIVIDGKKELAQTEKVLKLINKQLVTLNKNLAKIDATTGKSFGKLNNALIKTTSSSSKLGATIDSAFGSFEKGNETIRGLGGEFKELVKGIEKTAKVTKQKQKEGKAAIVTDAQRIKQLNKLVELNSDQEKELNGLLKAQAKAKNLAKERNDIAKQEAILETERKGTRKALKAQLALITIELNKKTEAEQLGTRAGRKLTKQQLKLNKTLFDLESKGGTFTRRVGEYARGLIRVDKAAAKATKGLKKFALRLTVGRSVLEGVSNGVRSAVDGLKQLVEEGAVTGEVFEKLDASTKGLTANLKTVGIRFLNTFGSGIAKVIDNFSFVFSVIADTIFEASESTGFWGQAIRAVGEVLSNFPAIWGGIIAVVVEFGRKIKTTFNDLGLRLERAKESFKGFTAALTGADTAIIEKNIARINAQLKQNIDSARTLGTAYTEGYNATIKAQEEFNLKNKEDVKIQAERAKAVERRNKAQVAAVQAEKKRIADEKRAAEKLINDRAELLSTIKSEAAERLNIAKDLQNQLIDLQIEAIKDETERALEAEGVRFERQKEARAANFQSLQDQAAAQEAEAARLFGAKSNELAVLEAANDLQLLELSKANDKVAEQEEQAHQDALLLIKKDAGAEQSEALRLTEEKDFENLLAFQAKEIAAEKKANEEKKALRESVKNETVNLVQTVFQAVSDIAQIAFDAENRRLDQSIEARKTSISSLNEELQNATGLQKKFLEQQVKQELEALEQETKNKEEARKEQAEAQKAIAITQAIIAAALAITNAFTLPPPASFIAAAATAVATGAQIAVIASQKFAKGGVIDGASHAQGGVPVFGGRVELEGDEGIINKDSMRNPLLRSIASFVNEAGGGNRFSDTKRLGSFAAGGLIGTPSVAPRVSSNSDRVLMAFDAKTDAINNRIDRFEVALDVNDLQDFEDNEAKLIALTTT